MYKYECYYNIGGYKSYLGYLEIIKMYQDT